jgi:hypothetical protein
VISLFLKQTAILVYIHVNSFLDYRCIMAEDLKYFNTYLSKKYLYLINMFY